jgi:hypothetical protein
VLELAKNLTSPLVNELLLPGARAAERFRQLNEIAEETHGL